MGAVNNSLAVRARALARRLRDERRERQRARRVAQIAATLTRPKVTEETTNLGPAMDALVTRAKRNQLPVGADPDYDLVRESFDHTHFLLQATVLHDQPEVDPIEFFLGNGARAVNSPDPNFSMGNYLERHPESATGERSPYLHWLKHGRAAGEIADPAYGVDRMAPVLGLTPAEVVREVVTTRDHMTERLRHGRLGEMFAKAAEIEPLIGASWNETARARIVPLGGVFITAQVAAIHTLQEQAGFERARLVLVTDRPRRAGERSLADHLAHALDGAIAPADIVVIHTDASGTSAHGRLPDGVRELDFFTASIRMPVEHREQALVALLRSFHADAIVNIDSDLLYRALTPYGKALAASERVYLAFACNAQRPQGNWEGWSLSWFYPGFDFVDGIITDSQVLADQIAEMYQLTEADLARVHVLRAPVQPELAAASAPEARPGRRPVVAWAGSWDRHRRVDLALEVARLMPDVDFRFHGAHAAHGDPHGDSEYVVPTNVTSGGSYGHLAELDLSGVDAWLYTSAWDGVPGQLLEVAMTEVPIVATQAGGVGEVLSEADSWLVGAGDGAESYVKALRELLADPAAARQRSHALRERLMRDRTRDTFAADAAALLLRSAEETGETGETSEGAR